MEAASKGQVISGMVDIALRSQKERMFVKQDGTDRITVIFSIEFPAYNDSVIGQVFCTVCDNLIFEILLDPLTNRNSQILKTEEHLLSPIPQNLLLN